MNILPINQTDNIYPLQKQQVFKGLWGESEIKFWERGSTDYRRETFHYHPHNDEADEKIESIVKKFTSDRRGTHSVSPQYKYHYIREVKIEQRLPFNESDWMQFLRNKYIMDKKVKRLIERTIRNLGLKTII